MIKQNPSVPKRPHPCPHPVPHLPPPHPHPQPQPQPHTPQVKFYYFMELFN